MPPKTIRKSRKVDYSNGKIYQIVCNKTGNVYVGSTAEEELQSRINTHITAYARCLQWVENGKVGVNKFSCKSHIILQLDDYEYNVIENYICRDDDELRERETHWFHIYKIQYGDLCVNKNVPRHTTETRKKRKKEWGENWRNQNPDYYKGRSTKWRNENIEKSKQHDKNRYERDKEKRKLYAREHGKMIRAFAKSCDSLNRINIF